MSMLIILIAYIKQKFFFIKLKQIKKRKMTIWLKHPFETLIQDFGTAQ